MECLKLKHASGNGFASAQKILAVVAPLQHIVAIWCLIKIIESVIFIDTLAEGGSKIKKNYAAITILLVTKIKQ